MQANPLFPAFLMALVAGCGEPTDIDGGPFARDTVRALTAQERQIAAASNQFAFELLREVDTSEAAKPNLMISPLSVSMALGMTLNGAAGGTFDAMRSTLDFHGLSQAEINTAYRGLIRQLAARDPRVEWRLANAIWHDDHFKVHAAFADTVRAYFDAAVRQIDFRSTTAPATISNWAEEQTGGRVKNLIRTIREEEVMFLVNAVYFKAPWTRPFTENATRPRPFTLKNGSRVDVAMMSVDASFRWVMSAGLKVVELPYADTAFSMVIWQGPRPTAESWTATLETLSASRVFLHMPKFKFDYEAELKPALTNLGMGIAFNAGAADFSRIAPVPPDLYLTRVTHKSYIDVHEKGTEAAAVTVVGVGVTSMPPTLDIDGPFYFAIRERSTGTILFAGRVNLPSY